MDISSTPIVRGRSARARHLRTSPALSPRDPHFVDGVLRPLADRHTSGEQAQILADDLYTALHPWALSFATAQAAGLPPQADRSELVSQVLRLTWEACSRIDWSRYDYFPAYLWGKVSRARVEAARTDDWLSRGERVRRRRFQHEIARREQHEGRPLTSPEVAAVADAVAPRSARVDWASTVLATRHPSTVAEVPDELDHATVETQIEDREVQGIRARCLAEWLSIMAEENEELAADLTRWSECNGEADRDLPQRLAHRIEPYRPLLLAMLGEAA